MSTFSGVNSLITLINWSMAAIGFPLILMTVVAIILLNRKSQNNGKCFIYATSLIYATIFLEGGQKSDDWREIEATA